MKKVNASKITENTAVKRLYPVISDQNIFKRMRVVEAIIAYGSEYQKETGTD